MEELTMILWPRLYLNGYLLEITLNSLTLQQGAIGPIRNVWEYVDDGLYCVVDDSEGPLANGYLDIDSDDMFYPESFNS